MAAVTASLLGPRLRRLAVAAVAAAIAAVVAGAVALAAAAACAGYAGDCCCGFGRHPKSTQTVPHATDRTRRRRPNPAPILPSVNFSLRARVAHAEDPQATKPQQKKRNETQNHEQTQSARVGCAIAAGALELVARPLLGIASPWFLGPSLSQAVRPSAVCFWLGHDAPGLLLALFERLSPGHSQRWHCWQSKNHPRSSR